MILHYLGLDHIGHLDGPHSVLVQSKLSEMDNIVERITSALYQQVFVVDVLYLQQTVQFSPDSAVH